MNANAGDHLGEEPDFDALFAAEQRHFWFRHRMKLVEQLFSELTAPLADGFEVLEVGCGNGGLTQVLERVCDRGRVTGSELFASGLVHAKKRVKCDLVQADVYKLPFGPRFDLVGMFDVLEHLPDDVAALRSLAGSLKGGGRIVLTVPAHMSLWSYADVASGHYRRYSTRSLRDAAEQAGFQVEYVTQFMTALFPMMMASRALTTLRNKLSSKPRDEMALAKSEFHVNPLVNRLMSWAMGLELPLLRKKTRLPVGTSLLMVASPRKQAMARAA